MARPLKITLAVVGGLLALLLGAIAVFIATFDANAYKPWLVETVKKEAGRTLAIPGPISLAVLPRLALKLGEVTLSERDGRERFAALRSAEVSLALWPLLKRQVVVDRIALDGLAARVVRFKDGRLNIDDLLAGADQTASAPAGGASAPAAPAAPAVPAAPAAPSQPHVLDIAGIALTGAEIVFDDRQAPRTLKMSGLDLETGRIAAGAATPVSLKAQLTADAPRLAADVALKGQFARGPAEGRVAFEGLVLDIAARLGAAGAAPLKLHAEGALAANLKAGTADAKLAGTFADSRFQATLAMPRLSPASYRFDAELDRLDLDRLLGLAGAASAASAPAGTSGAGEPPDLSALRGLDASGQLRIGALQVMNVKVSQVRAGLKAAGGRVRIEPLAAELYEGKLSGHATLDATTTPPRIGLVETLAGIAVGPLLKDFTGNDRLSGRGDVVLDVTTAGTTPAALTRALGGSVRVQLKDGAVRGINLAQTVRRARAAVQGFRDARSGGASVGAAASAALAANAARAAGAPAGSGGGAGGSSGGAGTAAREEATDFTELAASFAVSRGVARNDDLALKSPLMRIGGSGDIDLGASRLNYTVRATVVDTLKGQGGAELEALRGQTIPVQLSGPFDAIDWKIDLAAMAREAVGTRVEREIDRRLDRKREELKDEAKRRLGDKLREALGR